MVTVNFRFGRRKKYESRKNTASNYDETITKKPFSGWWDCLKSEKRVQILNDTPAKMLRKSQFQGCGRRSNFS